MGMAVGATVVGNEVEGHWEGTGVVLMAVEGGMVVLAVATVSVHWAAVADPREEKVMQEEIQEAWEGKMVALLEAALVEAV